jgi:hypothetical protein
MIVPTSIKTGAVIMTIGTIHPNKTVSKSMIFSWVDSMVKPKSMATIRNQFLVVTVDFMRSKEPLKNPIEYLQISA